jgi:hypothetical protein
MRFALLLGGVCAAAFYVVAFGLGEGQRGQLAFDVYGYYYPHMLYALDRLAAGGQGLLWNPFQNCGQPFFGITETGLLYPLNVFFVLFEPPLALRAVLFTNLIIGGLGMYGLGRQIGVSPVASIGAALAFVLGSGAYHMTTWMPTVQAPYVWMPVAMLCCERLIKAPALTWGLLLGITLAMGLLPGHPQFVMFTIQLVALRLLWSLVTSSERPRFAPALGYAALAVVVMLLLTAAQFVASMEVIGESIRSAALSPDEIAPRGLESLAGIARMIMRHESLAPFTIVPGFLLAVALLDPVRRRISLFYTLAGLLFFVLSFGNATPLGHLYYALPISSLFREPIRFRFVTSFCAAVLAGLAIDVLMQGRWWALAIAAATLGGFYLWLGFVWPPDLGFAAAILAAGALAVLLPRTRPFLALVVVVAIALSPVVFPNWTTQRFLADDGPLRAHAAVFERLHKRLTPQDRVHLALPDKHDPTLLDKTAMIFGLRAISDYELQLSRRYAEYLTMLRRGELLRNVNQVHFPHPWHPSHVVWPLVNLAAGRYLIIDKSHEQVLDPDDRLPLTFLDGDERVSVYENTSALPRAYYVPRIRVEPDGLLRIRRLTRPGDRRLEALVDEAPESGFLGVPANEATADARFVVDDPEHVVLETVAPERGFLFLADQYFPGWSATVNGQPAPILRANHAFRVVEVPSGPVTVEFRYRPIRVWIGFAISAVTVAIVAALLAFRGIALLRERRVVRDRLGPVEQAA